MNGIEAIKKVKGVKRHVAVDKNEFLIAVMVTVANVHHNKAAFLLIRVLKERCSSVKVILTDGEYRGDIIERVKRLFGYTTIQVIVSAYKDKGFRQIHKRWVVESIFSWFDNNRRLCRNYELTFDSTEEIVKIAAIRLLLNKI